MYQIIPSGRIRSQVQFPSNEDTVHCYFGINSIGKLVAYLVASSNDTENHSDASNVVYGRVQ